MRCSCVNRRDHVFGARYFSGSGFSDSSKRIGQDSFNNLQGPQRNPAVGFHPIAAVIDEFRVEDDFPFLPRLILCH